LSKPRHRWWGYVRNVIRAYPTLKEEYDELHNPMITAAYGGAGGARSSDIGNPTMKAAIRQLPSQEQREFEAVNAAVWVTERYPNGQQRIEIIRRMYWSKQQYSIGGAGELVGYGYTQARQIHREFVALVADYMGLK